MQTDHLGNHFKSVSAMTKHWGISRTTYLSRINMGWSVEKALTFTIREESRPKGGAVDHLGNKFKSRSQMLTHWGIRRDTYNSRLRRGWSLKEALTTPSTNNNRCKDHLGNEYDSKGDMFKTYGVSYSAFTKRIDRGWSLEEALTGNRGRGN